MKISDSELYARLAVLLDGEVKARMIPRQNPAQPYDLQLTSEVFDNHRGDSPDAILRITILLSHPSLPQMKIVVPVPLEGEKAGISAAIADLEKFAGRGNFPIEMPMLVVGGENVACQRRKVKVDTKVEIHQIPYRRIAP
jgi:hypothetical protein